tara:strand:+ start:2655 stop:2879 length:225 start_codon:yes stop_codon:yes gene_type:complete
LTQDGAQKLIANTLKAKETAKEWRAVASVLADALSALDFSDVAIDAEPYRSAVAISEYIKNGDLQQVLDIIKRG